MHDAYRVDKGGKPTFDRVMRGLDVLRRHEVDWNALTTVNAANGDHGREVYRFLRDELGARLAGGRGQHDEAGETLPDHITSYGLSPGMARRGPRCLREWERSPFAAVSGWMMRPHW
jgi:hypothetical protein